MAMVKLEPPARAHNISSSAYSYLIVFIIFGSFLAMTYLMVLSDYSLLQISVLLQQSVNRKKLSHHFEMVSALAFANKSRG